MSRPSGPRVELSRAGVVRLRLAVSALVLTACSAGTSPVEACVEHSLEEGVDRAAAEAACQDAVPEPD